MKKTWNEESKKGRNRQRETAIRLEAVFGKVFLKCIRELTW